MQVCQAAWKIIYDVSHNSTLKMVSEVKQGDLEHKYRNRKAPVKQSKQTYVHFWLDSLFKEIADMMPDTRGRIIQHLPEWMTYKWIHRKLCNETTSEGNVNVLYVLAVR